MSIKAYSEIVSPFVQSKVLFHFDRINEVLKNKITVPITCEIDLADGFCNNKCAHCFFGTNHKKKPIYIRTQEIKNVMIELAMHGVRGVEFSGGGEPTTHPDVVDIIDYASKVGLDAGLITNGLLIDKIFQSLKHLNFIRISLDAANEITYKKTHGVPYFNKIIENIKNINDYMSMERVGIGFLIVPHNIDDIIEAAALTKSLGVRFIQYRPASLEYEINDELWNKAKTNVKKVIEVYADNNFQVFDAGVKWTHVNKERKYGMCYTSSFVSVIKASGDIPLCILNRNNRDKYIGNIYDGGFFKHWGSEKHIGLIENINIQDCRKPCKHDQYNIICEAYKKDLFHHNFI